MGLLHHSGSVSWNVGCGIGAFVFALIICGVQKCCRQRLNRWFEIDVRETSGTEEDGSDASSHRDHNNSIDGSNPQEIQSNSLNRCHPSQNTEVTSDRSRLLTSESHINMAIEDELRSTNNEEETTNEHRNCCCKLLNCCFKLFRLGYFCFMWLYLFDFLADIVLSFKYLSKKEWTEFFLSISPGTLACIFSMIAILYQASTHRGLSWLPVLLVIVTSPFAKAIIYGWIVLIREQSWKKRWYLQVLTFLQLLEVCIEGIPQIILEYYIIFTEDDLLKSLQNIQRWFTLWSLVAVSISITTLTTTLDREEDTRRMYNESPSNGIQHTDEEYYWKKYKDNNCCLWYFYSCVVFFGRICEFVPRCIIYMMFIHCYGWFVFGCFVSVYFVILFIFSLVCFKKVDPIYSENNFLKPLLVMSISIGAFANLFFCYEWLFRFLWKKVDVYTWYFTLFYYINFSLCFFILFSAGKPDKMAILFFSPILPQILLLLLRICLRQKMKNSNR